MSRFEASGAATRGPEDMRTACAPTYCAAPSRPAPGLRLQSLLKHGTCSFIRRLRVCSLLLSPRKVCFSAAALRPEM